MNTDKLETKLMALVVSCRILESNEEIASQIMQCTNDIVKNCTIPDVVGRSEQLPILERCECEEPIKICMNCNGYVE